MQFVYNIKGAENWFGKQQQPVLCVMGMDHDTQEVCSNLEEAREFYN